MLNRVPRVLSSALALVAVAAPVRAESIAGSCGLPVSEVQADALRKSGAVGRAWAPGAAPGVIAVETCSWIRLAPAAALPALLAAEDSTGARTFPLNDPPAAADFEPLALDPRRPEDARLLARVQRRPGTLNLPEAAARDLASKGGDRGQLAAAWREFLLGQALRARDGGLAAVARGGGWREHPAVLFRRFVVSRAPLKERFQGLVDRLLLGASDAAFSGLLSHLWKRSAPDGETALTLVSVLVSPAEGVLRAAELEHQSTARPSARLSLSELAEAQSGGIRGTVMWRMDLLFLPETASRPAFENMAAASLALKETKARVRDRIARAEGFSAGAEGTAEAPARDPGAPGSGPVVELLPRGWKGRVPLPLPRAEAGPGSGPGTDPGQETP